MGDAIDNVKGVPGIGEKGARDLIAQYGSLEELLAHAAESQQALSGRPARPCRRRAAEPRAGADPHRRAGRVRRRRLRYRAPSRERAFEHFTPWVPIAGHGVRADRGHGRQGLHDRRHGRCAAGAGDRARAAGRFALRVLPGRSDCDARRHRRHLVLDRTAPRALHPVEHRGRGAGRPVRTGGRSTAPATGLGLDETLAMLRPVLEDPSIQKTVTT